jgi:tRNA threonylcarbamoyladenosine biosynthesis protein TsaB
VKPLILAIDTAHEYGSMALARGADVIEEIALHEPDGFAHTLYGHLSDLLRRRGVRLDEIDCFAAASGPGSFTGVRIGLACIKGLAEATGKPAVGVSNLQALATFNTAPLRAVLMDARRGEIYGAVYDAAGAVVAPETVGKLEDWLAALPKGDIDIISADPFDCRTVTAPRALAGAIAKIAAARWDRGEACDPAALNPNYVRRPDIRTK